MLASYFGIRKVKQVKQALVKNKKFEKKAVETEEKLKDILYLPIEYESDIAEEDDDWCGNVYLKH